MLSTCIVLSALWTRACVCLGKQMHREMVETQLDPLQLVVQVQVPVSSARKYSIITKTCEQA